MFGAKYFHSNQKDVKFHLYVPIRLIFLYIDDRTKDEILLNGTMKLNRKPTHIKY